MIAMTSADRRPEQRGGRFDQDRDDRGFLERARDEVTSWFGDERDDDRFARGDRDYGRFERSPRWRDEGYRRPYTGRFGGGRRIARR